MKFLTNEVKIALVAIVGIVVLFFGLQYLKGLTLLGSDNRYYAVFNNVSGLSASSPVYANGYKVGVVEAIVYDYANPEKIVAVLGLDNQLNVSRGTRAEIASDLLGKVQLELCFGENPVDLLQPGDTISGGMQSGLMSKAGAMVPQIERMLPKLDSILSSINTLLADPTLSHSLKNVEDITGNLTTTTAQLNTLTQTLNRQLPGMLTSANGLLANTEELSKQFSSIDLEGTMGKVNQTLANVEHLTETLNSKDGTLGLLLHDATLYTNLSNTMADADSLMVDFKAHPKRYIHFSVFGKKE